MEDDDKHAIYSDTGWNVEFKPAAEKYCRAVAAELHKLMPMPIPHLITSYRVDIDCEGVIQLVYKQGGRYSPCLSFLEVFDPPVDYNEEPTQLDANGSLEIAVADVTDALLMAQRIAALVVEAQKP